MELMDEIEKEQQKHVVEVVLEKLYPPPYIQHIHVEGCFGRFLPNFG